MVKIGDRIRQGSGGVDYGYAVVKDITEPLKEFNSKRQVFIEFEETGDTRWCYLRSFECGEVKNYFKPLVFGVGFDGELGQTVKVQSLPSYDMWKSMLCRSTESGRLIIRNSSTVLLYSNVSCDRTWYNFSKFHCWFEQQDNIKDLIDYISYYEKTWRFELDKDILCNGNKVYSEDTCCIVPKILNMAVTQGGQNYKKSTLPAGISYDDCGVKCQLRLTNACESFFAATDLSSRNSFIYYISFYRANKEFDCKEYADYARSYFVSRNLSYKEHELAAIGMAMSNYKWIKETYVRIMAEDLYNKKGDGRVYHLISLECYEALKNYTVYPELEG